VPDTVFEEANEIDTGGPAPDELLDRLKDGKVYLPQQAQEGLSIFSAKGNLIAFGTGTAANPNQVDTQM